VRADPTESHLPPRCKSYAMHCAEFPGVARSFRQPVALAGGKARVQGTCWLAIPLQSATG